MGFFSFDNRKKRLDAARFLRRVIDATTPNLAPVAGDLRIESRANRCAPALLVPFDDDTAIPSQVIYALTKDLSGNGVALVLTRSFTGKRVVIGFLFESLAGFVLGEVRQNVELGGGFWQLGIEVT